MLSRERKDNFILKLSRLAVAAPSAMVGSAGQVPDVEILVKMSPKFENRK